MRTGLRKAMAFGIVVFLFNDLVLVADGVWWIGFDWLSRAMVIVAVLAPLVSRQALRPLAAIPPIRSLAGWTLACLSCGMLAYEVCRFLPAHGLFHYPIIQDRALVLADAVIGIPLVAASEELVARAAPFLIFGRRFPRGWVVVSPLVFGLFHWGLGPASMAEAALTAIPLALSLRSTGSLWPAVGAHAALDLVLFTWPRL
ncbi:MAG: CPBP family intramembrane metalloprotease [Magnetospirillum sp.]|nr:CPBP family intramembrane metalloprotease [Magnetospirillum sp.]